MTIANYTELQDEVASLMHREGDTDFEGKLPLFVRLFETRASRELRVREMEETLASTPLVSGAASLPTGFRAFKELRFDGSPSYTLQPRSIEWIRAHDSAASGDAEYFAISGTQVVCWPTTGPIKGTYFKDIPALADNATNWLLTKNPDLYLFGMLTEAALWVRDDEILAKAAPRTEALIEALNREDQRNEFDGGILAVRAR